MSGAAWRLRRLRAMTAGEVAHRARGALWDRLAPPAWARAAPAAAFGRLFTGGSDEALADGRLAAWIGPPRHGAAFAGTLAAARDLAAGRFGIFGREVELSDPPAWRRNPLGGAEWPEAPASRLDYRRADVAGGAKPVWEVGRLTALPTLALAWRLTGEDAFAARAVRWLDDFCARNPYGWGIHHTSGLEMALRVLTVTATLALLGERARAADLRAGLGLLGQQALHCATHLSLGSSANNHRIAEHAAMAVAGALYPSLRDAETLLSRGHAGLEAQVLRQIHPDGVPAEQAFGYLPFVWELVLCGLRAAEIAGRPAAPTVRERLAASLEFARTIRLPEGRWPQLGDEDDGRVLLGGGGESRLDLAGNALAAWLGADGLSDDAPALAMLFLGSAPPARAAAERCHQFPDGGYTVWRERGLLVTWDHGPLGLGPLAAHGHADALSITVQRGGDLLIADSGTLAYHEDPEARDRCRSTPYHSTACFGERSQSELVGPFLWGRRARLRQADEGYECTWWSGERHWRRVELAGERVTVRDRLRGADPRLVLVLHPAAEVRLDGVRAELRCGASRAAIAGSGIGPWRLEPGEYAPRFAWRHPTRRLVAPVPGDSCSSEIRLGPA